MKDYQREYTCRILTLSLNRKINRGVNYWQEKKSQNQPNKRGKEGPWKRKVFQYWEPTINMGT